MFSKYAKGVLATLAILCSAFTATSINASACTNLIYQCTNPTGAWLRSEPNTNTDDNKICIIGNTEVINVIDTVNGWGMLEYTSPITGVTAIGYTALDLYKPILFDSNNNVIDVPNKLTDTKDKELIYTFLVGELGFNKASSTAIVTNMMHESRCNPKSESIDTNNLTSYGLCQWNGPRYLSLLDFCSHRDLDPSSADSQMKFLQWELEGDYNEQYNAMKGFSDNEQGAYDAGYYWASKFEVCSSKYWEQRAEDSKNNYQKIK